MTVRNPFEKSQNIALQFDDATLKALISGYMKLTREEAFAIRYHMGFSGIEDKNSIGKALEMYPLALALNVADMEASYYLEGTPDT